MSLVYWLPMVSDALENQGLSNAVPINHDTTIGDGKLGKCRNFSGTAQYIDTGYKESFGTGDFTISVWAKLNQTSGKTYQPIVSNKAPAGTSVGFAIYYNQSQNKFLWSTADGSVATEVWTINTFPASEINNKWMHIVMVRNSSDPKKGYFYINGERQELTTIPGIRNITNTTYNIIIGDSATHDYSTFLWTGSICDVRIYDHALSPREIKEISKGLVLHYPLNRGGFGQDNIISGTGDWLTWYKGSRWIISDGVLTYSAGSVVWNDADSPCIPWSNVDGKTITISVDLKSDDYNFTSGSSRGFSLCLVRKSTQETQNFQNRRRECTPIFIGPDKKNEITSQWKTFTYTYINFTDNDFTNTFNGGGGDWFGIYLWNYCDKSISVRNIKLEFGDKATPWTPSQVDMLYSKMGLDNNIEYDVSGYGNNGTKKGVITYSSDTPKYFTCSYFDGINASIQTPNFTTMINNDIPFTINLWFKKESLGTDNYETLYGGPSGFEMDTRSGSSTTLSLYMASTRGGNAFSPFNLNEWYMVTMVSDRTYEYYYVNGDLKKTVTAKTMPSGNYFIGALNVYTSQNYKGLMSDFRIYATALSADDILELYHTPASITNSGVLMTQGELSEV